MHGNATYSGGKCYYVNMSDCAACCPAGIATAVLAKPSPKESLEKNVNHPKRYTKGKIECIDALESAVVGKTPEEAICVANVIKYLWRYEEKEPLRSLKSAEWYLKRLISKYEASNAYHD
jgi:hypothetical protein